MQRQTREQGEGEPIDGKAFAARLRQRTGKGLPNPPSFLL
jgi:hypothetical protein